MRTLAITALMSFVAAACTAGPAASAPPSPLTTSAAPIISVAPTEAAASPDASSVAALTYVALGDSWPEGNHCGGCRTFAGRYADGLEAALGEAVEFIDLNGERTTQSTALLASLRQDREIRDAVARADVVMIATGPNEMEGTGAAVADGTCGGDDGFDCIRALGDTWDANFDASVAEVLALRDGKPTAIRLVNAANPFLSVPQMVTEMGLPADFAMTGGALLFELLTTAVCDAARTHGGQCVDVRPILNGPELDQPTDEDSPESHQAIADALVATGLAELGR